MVSGATSSMYERGSKHLSLIYFKLYLAQKYQDEILVTQIFTTFPEEHVRQTSSLRYCEKRNPLVPIRVKLNTISMFSFYIYFLVLIYKVLNNLMFSTKMVQERSKWVGTIMAINFYNFQMHAVIRSTDKYFISKGSLPDCFQMPYIHH